MTRGKKPVVKPVEDDTNDGAQESCSDGAATGNVDTERDLKMFRAYMEGTPMEAIAEAHALSLNRVYKIRKRDSWDNYKARLNRQDFLAITADVIRQREADKALQESGVQCDEQGRFYVEVDLIVPKGAMKPGQPYGVIPPPNQGNRIQTVLIDAEAGLVRTRYYLSDTKGVA